tara:strand:- start:846 stop:1046 length:201 start_codon:yes stop_codon:yes gene_type:complete
MTKTVTINGKEIPLVQAKVVTTYKDKKTGIIYNNEEDYKAANIPLENIEQDVKVIMPKLDLFGEKG